MLYNSFFLLLLFIAFTFKQVLADFKYTAVQQTTYYIS